MDIFFGRVQILHSTLPPPPPTHNFCTKFAWKLADRAGWHQPQGKCINQTVRRMLQKKDGWTPPANLPPLTSQGPDRLRPQLQSLEGHSYRAATWEAVIGTNNAHFQFQELRLGDLEIIEEP